MTRQQKIWLIGLGLGLGAGLIWLAHLSVSREVDLALAQASQPADALSVVEIPSHRCPFQGTALWAETTRAADGASLGGRVLIATAGGLLGAGGGGARTLLDGLDGPIDHDLTAVAADGTVAALGTRSGAVSLLEGDQIRSLSIEEGRFGAVNDLRWHRSALYVATASGTLVRVRGEQATALSPQVEGGLTALAQDPEGSLAAAGGDGVAYRVAGDRLEAIARVEPPQRLTALAWHRGELIAGTSTGLLRHDGQGALAPVRDDLFVTSLLSHDDQLLVATFDNGLAAFEGSRLAGTPRRRVLADRRVDRLRLIDGRPVAFGPGLAAVLELGGEARRIELPRGLSGNHITALALDEARRLWVGHFDQGVDVLDRRGEVVRHLPGPELDQMSSVNALRYDPEARAMLVATSHGVLVAGESGLRTLTRDDGLIGEAVTDILLTRAGRVFATSQGVTLAPAGGGALRSIYAFHGLPSNRVYALAGGPERLLAGTLGGLAELEGLEVRGVRRAGPSGLAANWCVALAAGREGVYVGTIGGGVDLVEPDRVTRLTTGDNEPFSVNPGALLLLDEALLVGTLERGLLIWDRRERTWRESEQPLPGASVTALLADDEHLYVGTDRGLLRLEREAIGV